MWDDIYFVNNNGERWDYDEDPINSGWIALSEITFDTDARSDDRPKMQRHGIWGNTTLAGPTLIHLEGNIIAGSPAQLNVYRLELMRVHMPPVGGGRYASQVGRIYMKYYGVSEYYYSDVGYEAFPRAVSQAFFPSVCPFTVTFKAFNGYMTGINSGQAVWIT